MRFINRWSVAGVVFVALGIGLSEVPQVSLLVCGVFMVAGSVCLGVAFFLDLASADDNKR